MDFSRLDPGRVILGMVGSAMVLISVLFLPWYSLSHSVARVPGSSYDPSTFTCGTNDFSCTGFDTFPILPWIIVRGHKLSWAPGEMTMVAGFAMVVLIGYNGILDKPGSGPAEVGVSLDYGYWIALVGAIAISATAFLRSQAGQKRERKAPGTV